MDELTSPWSNGEGALTRLNYFVSDIGFPANPSLIQIPKSIMHLFAYGTLMFTEVWRRIGIREFCSEPATLSRYAAYRLQGAVIPGMVRAGHEDHVAGLVFHDLDETTLFELDAYESELYERTTVSACLEDGSQLDCQAYIIPENRRQALSNELWDATRFEQQELAKYLYG